MAASDKRATARRPDRRPDTSGGTSGGFVSVRGAYDELGAEAFYAAHGDSYTNPHEHVLAAALASALTVWQASGMLGERRIERVLDVASGSGEASVAFRNWCETQPTHATPTIEACDPFTHQAYETRVGRSAERWSFADICGGVIEEDRRRYSLLLCSFCLHLLEKGWLHVTMAALARSAEFMIVCTPHKRPSIEAATGWDQLDERVHERVRVRLYRSRIAADSVGRNTYVPAES